MYDDNDDDDKTRIFALSWSVAKIILRRMVSKTSKFLNLQIIAVSK